MFLGFGFSKQKCVLEFYRCGVGQYPTQNLVSFTDGAGRNYWDVDYGWLCIWGE